MKFLLPSPYVMRHVVVKAEIDEYRHVNNAVYLTWLDRTAWSHSAELGLPLEHCLRLKRGMAVRHTRVDYLQAAREGDAIAIGTWIVASDRRLRCTRRFEILRDSDSTRLLEAELDYVCLNLETGRPTRFPTDFTERYRVDPAIAQALTAFTGPHRTIGSSPD